MYVSYRTSFHIMMEDCAYMSISEEIADNLLAMGAWEGYALVEIEAVIQRSFGTFIDRYEVEKILAVTT